MHRNATYQTCFKCDITKEMKKSIKELFTYHQITINIRSYLLIIGEDNSSNCCPLAMNPSDNPEMNVRTNKFPKTHSFHSPFLRV